MQLFGRAEPDYVISVILDLVAGKAVGKHGQASAIGDKPRDDVAKSLGRNCELAGAARMGSYRAVMHASHRNPELVARGLAQTTGSVGIRWIVIDVSVIGL